MKASNSVECFSEEKKEIQLQYEENPFEKELLSSVKQRLELGRKDLKPLAGFQDIRAKLKITDNFSHALFHCICKQHGYGPIIWEIDSIEKFRKLTLAKCVSRIVTDKKRDSRHLVILPISGMVILINPVELEIYRWCGLWS